ncbi:hypothetical protein [Pedobacter sp. UYP1]|uniref:hypothetical protein n=1 Tax=Pedobacter sp. UYP1 TaxID=1756396 RepID=UPI00339AF812
MPSFTKNITKNRLLSIAANALKKIKKRNSWERQRNIVRNSQKKGKRKRTRYPGVNRYNPAKNMIIPVRFNLLDGKDEVLVFFEKCKVSSLTYRKLHFVFDNVEDIGHGAVTILLSICGYLKDQGVSVSGSYPNDVEARTTFEKSGFLRYFNAHYTKKENMDSPNEILQRGLDKTNPKGTAKKIRGAMKTVWGTEQKNTGIQGLVIEIMANTVNHAYNKYHKGWYFSVDHDNENNSVKFCFVDNGLGILNTIKIKLKDIFGTFIGITNDGQILKNAFDGRYGSRTRLSYRGRGLPAIKKNFDNNIIKNLVVISNNVYLNFEDGTFEVMPISFTGTFYYWEIDQTCKNNNNV